MHYLGLEKSAMDCNKEIHTNCDILVSTIEEKRKSLLNTVQNLKNKRRAELEAELKKLQEINESAMKLQGECKDIASKSDISSSLRLEQMTACIDQQYEMEKKVDYDIDKMNLSNIKLCAKFNKNAFHSNFDSALNVQFGDDKFKLKYQDYDGIKILKFSTEFITPNELQLSDDNRCVKKINTSDHTYVLADIDPVTTGIHCWRIKV